MIPVTFVFSGHQLKRLVHVVPRKGDRVVIDDAPYKVHSIAHGISFKVERHDIMVATGRGSKTEPRTMASNESFHHIRIELEGLSS